MPAGRDTRREAPESTRFLRGRLPRLACATVTVTATALLLGVAAASAQPVRVIPQDAQAARLVLAAPSASAPQTATLDGKTVGVAPGLRLFGTDNQLLATIAVAGQKLPVRYKLDLYGQLLTAWVLSEPEQKALKQKS
ncbi:MULTISPECIES: hypothetical protein [unclassified Cupriavidus]|uniref:hypothetical protein n=1 Tax=unclassified Cupriavidus TaxID=2640874 RepID=UPI001AE28309|nr:MULTISPECIES: hypothetical protein [unclassified Cupriavidus]MBP0627489.1 hypothetical protein [Cupriavidus sp. AcVe19-1a]MBP0635138.1 hypothetical protein [Cupriavidus sp. AcVe19-6a]